MLNRSRLLLEKTGEKREAPKDDLKEGVLITEIQYPPPLKEKLEESKDDFSHPKGGGANPNSDFKGKKKSWKNSGKKDPRLLTIAKRRGGERKQSAQCYEKSDRKNRPAPLSKGSRRRSC